MIAPTAHKINTLFEIAYQYVSHVGLRIPWGFEKVTVQGVRKIKLIALDLEYRITVSEFYNSFLLVNWKKKTCPLILNKKKISPMQFLGPALNGM